MLSLKLSKVFPQSNLMISLPVNSQYYRKSEEPLSSSLRLFSISKSTGEKPNLQCFFRPPSSILTSRFATAASYAVGAAVIEESVIELPGELQPELMPKHIAVILDGNGRWAKSRGQLVQYGHKAAMVTLKNLAVNCCEFGIKVEVDFLMMIIESFIRSDVMELIKRHNIRFSVIGHKSRLPKSLQSAVASVEEASLANKGMHFLMALSYGGRYEMAEACKKIAIKVKDGVLRAQDINDSVLDKQLMTNLTDFPNRDLIIRTSGELRVSNFLLWQLAYAEFYFASKMFPDFEKADLIEALTSFQQRKRLYGKRLN